jgi:Carboxypeptidase regulatory-like domain/TonB dependent receptor
MRLDRLPHYNLSIFVFLICLAVCIPVTAQVVSVAQINGTVKDPSDALLPGVEVKVTQTETGYTRTVVSNETGTYTLPSLSVGPYRLEASLPGFKTYVQTGIVLQVNSNPTIPVVLTLGAVTETIQVEANAATVETNSNSVGQVIDQQRVIDLPLNGRNVTQLVTLSGGAVDVGSNLNLVSNKTYPGSSAFFIAGGQGGSTLFVLDGAPHMDPLSNVGLPMPFPDALQEFKVETSSLPANYGTQPGGVVNVATKAGTNEFHGTAFEFLRNYAMNAKNYFATTKDGLKRNQFGGTLGGPIVKNKVFFFAGYQGTRETIAPAANIGFVPSAAMLRGDFTQFASAACNNGTAKTLKTPFVGNTVSPSAFNPVAMKVVTNYLPLSDDPCGKLTFAIPGQDHENQEMGRIDWHKSERNSVFGRYFIADYQHPPFFERSLLTISTDPSAGLSDRVQAFAFGDTLTLNPSTLLTSRISYSRSKVKRYTPSSVPTLTELGANVTSSIPNYLNLSVSGAFAVICNNCSPSLFASNNYQLNEDFTMLRGRHEIALGGSWLQLRQTGYGNFQRNGTFSFNGQITGAALADFMLGFLSSTLQSNGQVLQERMNLPSLYAQDNIRINSRLKLNLGLRWDPYLLPNNIAHKASIFDPEWFNAGIKSKVFTNAPAGTLFYGDPGMPGSAYGFGKKANFDPRVGIVFDPRGKGQETLRAGYGIFYGTPNLFLTPGTHAPWANSVSLSQPAGGLSDPYSTYPGGNPFPSPDNPPANIQFPIFGGGLGNYKLHPKPTYMEQWNVSYQRQLPGDWAISVSYLGNRTVHLEVGEPLNNVVHVPGTCTAGQYGLTAAGACSTAANENYRRQFILANPTEGQYYAALTNFGDAGIATYNGLLTSVQHRFANGFSILANHTWSHCLTEAEVGLNGAASPQNYQGRHAEYANCLSDRRHLLNVSAVARSPKFNSAWLARLAGNWQIAPIFTARTGGFLTVGTGTDTSLLGVTTRPNLIGDPTLSTATIQKWFNTSAFVAPGPGQFGNVGRSTILGPGAWNIDVNLSRGFTVGEGRIITFRAEAFNVMNHPRFGNPGTSMNSSATFGVINTALDPRIMQLALKYTF